MDIEKILKQAEQETLLFNQLQKAAEELEADNPEMAGSVVSMIDQLSDEDIDYILAEASAPEETKSEEKSEEKAEAKSEEKPEEKSEEKTETKSEDKVEDSDEDILDEGDESAETDVASEDGSEGEGEQEVAKAASEQMDDSEQEMLDKVAEADVLAEYLGSRVIDSMIKRAAEYGVEIQTPESATLEAMVNQMGEKLAESLVGHTGEKLASAEEMIEDEKVAQELYDIGRLACIGRLYLEELQGESDSDA